MNDASDAYPASAPASPADTGTRDAVILSAARMLGRHGPSRVSLDDIAKHAKVSRRTLYRHFGSRDELIEVALDSMWGDFLKRAGTRLDKLDSLEAQVAELAVFTRETQLRGVDLAFRRSTEMAELISTHYDLLLRHFVTFLKPYIEAAVASGELRAGLNTDRAADWLTRVLSSLWPPTTLIVNTEDETELRQFVRDFVVSGLR